LQLEDIGMVRLTFYGGVNEIGGNKILVEDGKTRVFFDFGLSFAKGQEYYTGFLSPRSVAGAADDLELGILPSIKGLYSKEMLKFTDLEYEEPKFDALFLSHAHTDHCSHLQYLDESIPVYVGECTLKIIESFDPSSDVPEAFGEHSYRTFRTGDKVQVGDMTVEPIHVDHSVPGAYGYLIHTSAGTIAYTGDLRRHGPASFMTEEFARKAAESDPVALICEGTRLGRKEKGENLGESGVKKLASSIVSRSRELAIATFYGRDADRIRTFYEVAKESDRQFIVSMRTANLLYKLKDDKVLRLPNPLKDKHITIYARRKASGEYQEKDYYKWERPYLENSVGFRHIHDDCQKCLLNLDLYNFAELVDIKPRGGDFIHSMSEPFPEGGMDQIESVVMQRWLNHFNLRFHQAHASGHCSQGDLQWLINEIKPKQVIPIHTERSELFPKITRIPIVEPKYQKSINIH
jgi:ribonuclease J